MWQENGRVIFDCNVNIMSFLFKIVNSLRIKLVLVQCSQLDVWLVHCHTLI